MNAMPPEAGSAAVRNVPGSVIRDLLALTERPEVISLAGGLPAPELLPTGRIAAAAARAAAAPSGLQYGVTTGAPALREVLRARESALVGRDVGDPVVTHGSQQGLTLLARALLDPGDVVVVEDPGYTGALQVFASVRARVVPVPMDGGGMRIDALERVLATETVRLVHTVSNFQNPRGVSLDDERRRALAALADRHGFWIVEDDPYGRLRFAGEAIAPVAAHGDRVLRLSSASKVLAPALRVGWLHGDPRVLALVERLKQGADLCGSSLTQLIAAELLADADWFDSHLARLCRVYGERAAALRGALAGEFGDRLRVSVPRGGMFCWAEFTDGTDTTESAAAVVAAGTAYIPGSAFGVAGGAAHRSAVRLCFTTASPAELSDAARRLGAAMSGPAGATTPGRSVAHRS